MSLVGGTLFGIAGHIALKSGALGSRGQGGVLWHAEKGTWVQTLIAALPLSAVRM